MYHSTYILQLHHIGGTSGKTRIPPHLLTKHMCSYVNSRLNSVKETVLVERMAVVGIVVVVLLNLEVEKMPYIFTPLLDNYPT
jgi:hypothetical protein